MANKDKKKLRDQLIKQGFDPASVEAFLDDKQFGDSELIVDKIQGSKVQIISRDKNPLMFTSDSKQSTIYIPTLYLLFQLEKLPGLRINLKEGVEKFMFNGADLMWPGIQSFNTEDFRQYDVAVIYALNQEDNQSYVPVAVGKILASKIPEDLKGKAVQVEHFLYDELWNSGCKKIPAEIRMQAPSIEELTQPQEVPQPVLLSQGDPQTEEESKQQQVVQEPEEEEKKQTIEVTEERAVPVEDMDVRIVEAFYRCLIESVKDDMLPMEPSDFQKDHLNLYRAAEYKLDLRLTSFKRVGKLLEIMHKKGVVDYSEIKGFNHKLISKINRDNEEFKNYKPIYSLKRVKKQEPQIPGGEEDSGYPKINIEELYEPTKHLNAVFGMLKDTELPQFYSLKECRDLLCTYIRQNELDGRKGMIKVDPILMQLLSRSQVNSENEVAKDLLLKSIPTHLKECYQITMVDEEEIVKSRVKTIRGAVPRVFIKAHRVQNKKQTVIVGLELYQIDYEELVPYLAQKCAGSATLHEATGPFATGKKDAMMVCIQGQHLDTVRDILVKRYKVPVKYIDTENAIDGKKKKKQ